MNGAKPSVGNWGYPGVPFVARFFRLISGRISSLGIELDGWLGYPVVTSYDETESSILCPVNWMKSMEIYGNIPVLSWWKWFSQTFSHKCWTKTELHDVEALHQMSRFQGFRPFLEVPRGKLGEAAGVGDEEQVVVILPKLALQKRDQESGAKCSFFWARSKFRSRMIWLNMIEWIS